MQFPCPSCNEPLDFEPAHSTRDAGGEADAETIDGLRCAKCGFVSTPSALRGTVSFADAPTDAEPSRIAHFELVRILGRGSFGTVWLANDITLQREVALKLAHPRHGETANLVHEAQASAGLRHPNIVAVYEVGSEGDQVFIASEFVDGLTLGDLLSKGKPKVETAVGTLASVARALHYAHEHGIVHRDVKPANILLDGTGTPHVADFGIAKRIAKDATISTDGQVVGTALYMSPEQASGMTRETDRRSDVYAIGVILFEMLTGFVPFRGNTRAVLHQKVFEDPPSPRTLLPSLPRDLETICLRCLDREPARRYATAEDVAAELDRFSEGVPIEARPITRLERAWRWCRRRPGVASLVLGLFLSLSIGLAGVTFFWLRSEAHAQRAAAHAQRTGESLYRSQMMLASHHLLGGDLTGIRSVIRRFDEGTPFEELRGFEWRYFDRLTSELTEIANLGEPVAGVAISLDGEFCAASAGDERVLVWATRTGKLVRELRIEKGKTQGRVLSLDFSPTRNYLAAAVTDGTVRIWNPAKDGNTVIRLKHGPPVHRVRFSPGGRSLLSMGDHGAIRIWNLDTEKEIDAIPSGQAKIKDARFSRDGERLAVATDDDRVRLWRIGERPPLDVLENVHAVERIIWSADDQSIVSGSYNGAVQVRSVEDGSVRSSITTQYRVGDVEAVSDSTLIAILTNDNRIRLYDTNDQQETMRRPVHNLGFGVMALSADGRHLVVGSGDGSIRVMRIEHLRHRDVHWFSETDERDRTRSEIRSLAFLGDGNRIVAAGPVGVPQIRVTATGEPVDSPAKPARTDALIVVPGRNVTLIDRATGAVVHEIDVPGTGLARAALSPDGSTLAAVRNGPLHVYSVGETVEEHYAVDAEESPVDTLAFLPAVKTPRGSEPMPLEFAVAREDRTVTLYAAADGKPHGSPITFEHLPHALAACEGGAVLAVGTDIGTIVLWDRATRSTRTSYKVHAGRINALATLPNGKTIVSGGRDHVLVLSDSVSGEPIAHLVQHDRQIFAVAVSPNGHTLASGGLGGDVRIWRSMSAAAPRR